RNPTCRKREDNYKKYCLNKTKYKLQEMLFEKFDNKIRDAADHHHPAYDEQAWTKMEKLLNKHLPLAEKDNRKIIFFLLLFLFLGGGTWLFINRSNNGHKNELTANR